MSTKKVLFTVLIASIAAVLIGTLSQPSALALPAPVPRDAGITIPYSGRLTNAMGQPVADGMYDFYFALYAIETGGAPLWSETQPGVMVKNGTVLASLGKVNPLDATMLEDRRHWLAVSVRGPGERDFTVLTPRQALGTGSSAPSAAPATGSACPHDHLYEEWVGSSAAFAFSIANNSSGHGLQVSSNATGWDKAALRAVTWSSGSGIYTSSGTGNALMAQSAGGGCDQATLHAENTNTGFGMAGYLTNNSGYHTIHLYNAGSGGILYLQNGGNANGTGGGDFITAMNKTLDDPQFRVTTTGAVMSDFGYTTPAVDFAEMLPAVDGLEPGDVLAIGDDGKLIRSTQPYQTSVAGVYSTQPGFLGGHPISGPISGTVPLALVGMVPVKVSAENGAIRSGDLLVAASLPGYAMKAGANPPQGTVIGKAMEKLDAGTGIIKMLVTLQ